MDSSKPFPSICFCTLPIHSPQQKERIPSYRAPRLAVVSLRDYLVRNNFPEEKFHFLDIEMLSMSDSDLSTYFSNHKYDIVGLSAVLSHSYAQVKRASKLIREINPGALIVLGGHLATSANVILRKTEIDLCVVGDGELPFLNIVEYWQKHKVQIVPSALKQVRGLAFLDTDNNLTFTDYSTKTADERLPVPDYELFKSGLLDRPELVNSYFALATSVRQFSLDKRTYEPHRKPYFASVPSTKGCTARCTFCQRSTKGYRRVNLDDVESHICELIEKYDVGFISVQDENFGSRKDHTYAWADLMAKYDLIWQASGIRCTNVNADDVKYYKERGCSSLTFGIESGSQRILDMMEKNFDIEDVVAAVTACWDNKMYSALAFMVGMPGENSQTIRETGAFMGRMAHQLGMPPNYMDNAVFYAISFPGTPLYNFAQQLGLVGTGIEEEEKYLMKLADLRTNKWDYMNLNGKKSKEVLSWDLIVRAEANRTFSELNRKKPIRANEFAERWKDMSHWGKSRPTITNMKTLLLYVEEVIHDSVFAGSVTRFLPRPLAYWLIKNLYFFNIWSHYKVKQLLHGRNASGFRFYRDRQPNSTFDELEDSLGSARLERSLRHIVATGGKQLEEERGDAINRLMRGAVG